MEIPESKHIVNSVRKRRIDSASSHNYQATRDEQEFSLPSQIPGRLGYFRYCYRALKARKIALGTKGNNIEIEVSEGILVRILLVDDNQMVRRSLRRLLEQHDAHWQVCGEASNGREAVASCERLNPDVVVLDFKMPEMNGLEAAREITHQRHVPVLLVSMFLNEQLKEEARRAGVRGTCAKEKVGCVVQAVEAVLRDENYFSSLNDAIHPLHKVS